MRHNRALILTIGLMIPALTGVPAQASPATPAKPYDFNGDGHADLTIGVPGEDVGRRGDAGMVNVLPGSPVGPTAYGDRIWHQNRRGVRGKSETADRFGDALASGDFNADGYADLAVGLPGESIRHRRAGMVQVLYGGPRGLTAAGDQTWHQNRRGVPGGNESGDLFGAALAAGDFQGDGYVDLAIGQPGESVGYRQGAGRVVVLRGSPWGLTSGGAQVWSQDSPGVPDWAETGDGFGTALATGDVNNDGLDDLAISAAGEATSSSLGTSYGAVHVLLGTRKGLTGTDSRMLDGLLGERGPYGRSGDLVTGDFNNDGRDDIAVGALAADSRGAVLVFHATATGFAPMVDRVPAQGWWTIGQPDGLPGTATPGDELGAALAAGDLTGDGIDDLAIGAPGYDPSGTRRSDVGSTFVLAGAATGMTPVTGVWATDAAQPGDRFGASLAALPLSGGTTPSLVVGAPGTQVKARPQAGAVTVYPPAAGHAGAPLAGTVWHQGTPGVKGGPELFDHLGSVLGK